MCDNKELIIGFCKLHVVLIALYIFRHNINGSVLNFTAASYVGGFGASSHLKVLGVKKLAINDHIQSHLSINSSLEISEMHV